MNASSSTVPPAEEEAELDPARPALTQVALRVDADSVRLVGLVRDFTARLNRWIQDNAHTMDAEQLMLLARRAERLRFAAQHSGGRASRVTEAASKQLLAALPADLPLELKRAQLHMTDELARLRRLYQYTVSQSPPRTVRQTTAAATATATAPRSRLRLLLPILAMTVLAWIAIERPQWIMVLRTSAEAWWALVDSLISAR